MATQSVAARHRRPSRRARWLLSVVGVVFAVTLVNWLAVSAHISDLHHQATMEERTRSADDIALGLRADASDYEGARTLFAVLTVAFGLAFVGVGANALRQVATIRSRPPT